MTIFHNGFPADDLEYQDKSIAAVRGKPGSWDITVDDGWSLWAECDWTPLVGQSIRTYGMGIGFAYRGLYIDGRKVFYRTAAEQMVYERDRTYPRTARLALEKWDSGESVWSVELGGIGPGYEQAIQIGIFETIRVLLAREFEHRFTSEREADKKLAEADAKVLDAALREAYTKFDLGLSGAQAGAIKWMVYRTMRDGWQAVVLKAVEKKQTILVSNHWPGKPTEPTP